MNENSTNTSNPVGSCTVISKYFSSSPVMDESLSDFKEKRGKCKGPKTSQKPIANKKPKKLPKRIKGQKDIRTVLKKNEQLIYAKEFDDVCKQAGIDIDSEQLQLAVALSKSLQSEEDGESKTSQHPLNSQQRTIKIRRTLQEYGFAVPETKINKRKRKHKKEYKLLLSTEAERQQVVSDRYSQVLFQGASYSKPILNCDKDYSLIRCYYVATDISYEEFKNNSVLYVDNLVDKSTSNGSLLKDWANIPGRPQSPLKREELKMNFSEIECSQEELDIVLSGTLKCARDIVKKKVDSLSNNLPKIVIDVNEKATNFPIINDDKNEKTLIDEESVSTNTTDVSGNKTLSVSDRVRSCSPDIFDDDVSLIENDTNIISKEEKSTNTFIVMDLTDKDKNNTKVKIDLALCSKNVIHQNGLIEDKNSSVVDLTQTENDEMLDKIEQPQDNYIQLSPNPISQCSQGSNFTKRNSNDFMEITECVGITSPKITSKTVDKDISKLVKDSSKARRYSEELMEVIECVAMSCSQENSNKEQSQATISQIANNTKRKSNDLMEITECAASTSNFNPIDAENEINTDVNGNKESILDNIDLSQTSDSGDALPVVRINESNNSLDDTILLNSDEIIDNKSHKLPVKPDMPESCLETSTHTLDLTESPSSPVRTDNYLRSSNHSFFDEFVHNHSEETTIETSKNSTRSKDKLDDNDEIDLTQSSNSSEGSIDKIKNNINISNTSLGKKDDVSIDYDDMFDVIASRDTDVSIDKGDPESSVVYDEPNDIDDDCKSLETQSHTSQVFDLSDKELEYSLNKSRSYAQCRVEFGGISIIDNDLSLRKSRISFENVDNANETANRSLTDSFLPTVDIKRDIHNQNSENKFKTPFTCSKEKAVTPFRSLTSESVNTPSNEDYIVKTDQVTPMMDYASMSTPERNKELDKYGLKPFKRKRAIQLLTHLYNQTHPIVESCQEDQPSPSKKRKSSQTSPRKLHSPKKSITPIKSNSPRKLISPITSPRKLLKSPVKASQCTGNFNHGNKENIYEVTNENPEVKAIECLEEDWVFQKREKAKLHSCRVPLHIALHNYVSCRSRLHEAILRYEPVNIDVIHKELVASGHRYDPKDLLKYLDKRCITVKTADNNARNKR